MKRRTVALVACVAAVAAGCNSLGRQPRLQDATISPAALKPGDSAVITIKVADKHQIIRRVVAVVKEDPRVKLRLHDDGTPPDAKAGDGIWSRQVDVPFMAPPGQFTLEITAYNSKDEPVLVKIAKGQTGPLTATCALAIEYPPGGAAGPQAPAPQAPEQAAPAQQSPPKKP
jgi:hypothetical protein